jgi:uncharacterized membrane protein (DUF2068 family)
MSEKKELGRGWLTAIAIFKLVKAAGLIAIGVIALTIAKGDSERALAHWEALISLSPGHRLLHQAIAKIGGLEPRQLAEIGVGTFVYAAVFLVEGMGLILKKGWAEYVTSGVTLSFIPLEVYELVEKTTWARAIALVVNILVVVYLVFRIRREKREKREAHPGAFAIARPHGA